MAMISCKRLAVVDYTGLGTLELQQIILGLGLGICSRLEWGRD